ncbi:MAG: hypothetical protein PWP70_828 [Moorella sp. (in: firmicutes)]|nr:hypothetical protein [Moorella sp. (in: firmicutes)]
MRGSSEKCKKGHRESYRLQPVLTSSWPSIQRGLHTALVYYSPLIPRFLPGGQENLKPRRVQDAL